MRQMSTVTLRPSVPHFKLATGLFYAFKRTNTGKPGQDETSGILIVPKQTVGVRDKTVTTSEAVRCYSIFLESMLAPYFIVTCKFSHFNSHAGP